MAEVHTVHTPSFLGTLDFLVDPTGMWSIIARGQVSLGAQHVVRDCFVDLNTPRCSRYA